MMSECGCERDAMGVRTKQCDMHAERDRKVAALEVELDVKLDDGGLLPAPIDLILLVADRARHQGRLAGFEDGLKVVHYLKAGGATFCLSEKEWDDTLAYARRNGAEAMREAAAKCVDESTTPHDYDIDMRKVHADEIRALSLPGKAITKKNAPTWTDKTPGVGEWNAPGIIGWVFRGKLCRDEDKAFYESTELANGRRPVRTCDEGIVVELMVTDGDGLPMWAQWRDKLFRPKEMQGQWRPIWGFVTISETPPAPTRTGTAQCPYAGTKHHITCDCNGAGGDR